MIVTEEKTKSCQGLQRDNLGLPRKRLHQIRAKENGRSIPTTSFPCSQ